ncbi:DUF1963 domain-containing protein [Winogradskyella sp. 3972H.M.0a.05]|uniref:YwqG family protein n=1 Tax=Winogradskyella sp. 3972H.M.0a.05 TaxID=2950277 RepID=UPI003398EFE4
MIPEFLMKYASDLKKYERESVRINAKPRKEKLLEDNLSLKESKFLGFPFFPKDREYPKDKNGKAMIMVAQINFEQVPHLEFFPEKGILQLFLSPTDWYEEDVAVIYHSEEELTNEYIEDFSFLKMEDYEDIPIYKLHQLSFEKVIDKGGSEDSQFDYLFDENDYWDFIEGLSDDQEEQFSEYFNAMGHKIGGYAEFTQYDPRGYGKESQDDIQVLQIDVDDHIMFGDSGLAHIFISKDNLIKKDFSKAYFYWDCC